MKKLNLLTLMLLIIAALLVGCGTLGNQEQSNVISAVDQQAENGAGTDEADGLVENGVNLLVTKHFGDERVFNGTVALEEGWTVYDLLAANLALDTDYGGSFISGINGIVAYIDRSDQKRYDWFFYVNGVCADVGAMDYQLQVGDCVWWDYHGWIGSDGMNAAVIGGYPALFTNGYSQRSGNTKVIYADGCKDLAEELIASMEEQGCNIELVEVFDEESHLVTERSGPTIVIGLWENLKVNQELNDLNEGYAKNGLYMHYTETGLDLWNYYGDTVVEAGKDAGTIIAHGNVLGDVNPLWVISATNENGLQSAVRLLEENDEVLEAAYGVAVDENGIQSLPINP